MIAPPVPGACRPQRPVAAGRPRPAPDKMRPAPGAARAPAGVEIAGRARPAFGEARRRREPAAALASPVAAGARRLVVALERSTSPAIGRRPVAAPDLLAARPGRLAGRALAPRQPGIFLRACRRSRATARRTRSSGWCRCRSRRSARRRAAARRCCLRRDRRWRRCVLRRRPPASRMRAHAWRTGGEIAAVQPHGPDLDAASASRGASATTLRAAASVS